MQSGEVVLCKGSDGSIKSIAKYNAGGFEVNGQLLTAAQFEQLAGSREVIVRCDGRPIPPEAITNKPPDPDDDSHMQLLDDENDEYCFICALGGDLICCETCPATFHTECIGLTAVPLDDWYCPACRCAMCGGTSFEGPAPTPPPERLSCANYSYAMNNSTATQNGGHAEHAEGSAAAAAAPTTAGVPPLPRLHLDRAAPPTKQYIIKKSAERAIPSLPHTFGGATAMQLDGRASAVPPPVHPSAAASGISPAAEVRCCGGGPRYHFACLPAEAQEQLSSSAQGGITKPWYPSPLDESHERGLAEYCTFGRVPVGQLSSSGLQLSFQLIHAAAVAGGPCGGFIPDYSDEQRGHLRRVLSAALQVLKSAYRPLPDSRTGLDILPWLLRGAKIANGSADFSGTFVGVLFAGNTVVGAACVRSLSGALAEIPIFGIRQEVQRNGLGELLLSRIERVLVGASIEMVLMPGMVVPGWSLSPASFHEITIPGPTQAQWGYSVASRHEMQRIARHRPLCFPGVFTCVKRLSGVGALPRVEPRALPAALELSPDINVSRLQEIKSVEFRRDNGTGAPLKMTAPAGGELFVKPAEVPVVALPVKKEAEDKGPAKVDKPRGRPPKPKEAKVKHLGNGSANGNGVGANANGMINSISGAGGGGAIMVGAGGNNAAVAAMIMERCRLMMEQQQQQQIQAQFAAQPMQGLQSLQGLQQEQQQLLLQGNFQWQQNQLQQQQSAAQIQSLYNPHPQLMLVQPQQLMLPTAPPQIALLSQKQPQQQQPLVPIQQQLQSLQSLQQQQQQQQQYPSAMSGGGGSGGAQAIYPSTTIPQPSLASIAPVSTAMQGRPIPALYPYGYSGTGNDQLRALNSLTEAQQQQLAFMEQQIQQRQVELLYMVRANQAQVETQLLRRQQGGAQEQLRMQQEQVEPVQQAQQQQQQQEPQQQQQVEQQQVQQQQQQQPIIGPPFTQPFQFF